MLCNVLYMFNVKIRFLFEFFQVKSKPFVEIKKNSEAKLVTYNQQRSKILNIYFSGGNLYYVAGSSLYVYSIANRRSNQLADLEEDITRLYFFDMGTLAIELIKKSYQSHGLNGNFELFW